MEIVEHKNYQNYQRTAVGYTRLSVEEAKEGESSSIINQKSIITQYCKDNNINLVNIFADDGFSGSNFDRPAFIEMMEYLRNVPVDMVITKDLSRLGRDMTESSHYAEIIFPEMNIHYIAISDNFDSTQVNVMAPFQFAMNDVYLRETSRKINQVIETKRRNGEYCACAPFGYMKEKGNNSHLVPNPDTAPIVQYIFKLAYEGMSTYSIATRLTEEKIITPLKYRVQTGNFTQKGAAKAVDEWNHTTVKRILQNEVYLGHTILGKRKKVSLKSKKRVYVPKEDWCVTKNTHTPIVTQETFDEAQRYLGIHTKAWEKNGKHRQSIFNGITHCASCGGSMCSCGSVYNGERNKYWYLSCLNIPKSAKVRCEHGARIKYADLLEIVKNELNYFISLSDTEIQEITTAAVNKINSRKVYQDSGQNKQNLIKRLDEIDRLITKLYNDNIAGFIDDNRLRSMIADLTDESKTIEKRMQIIESQEGQENNVETAYNKFFELIKQYTHIDVLTEEIVRTFIERIDIGEKILPEGYQVASHHIPTTQEIKITYRFIGCLDDGQLYDQDNNIVNTNVKEAV